MEDVWLDEKLDSKKSVTKLEKLLDVIYTNFVESVSKWFKIWINSY